MDVRRVLYRIWIVVSLSWVTAVIALGWGEIKKDRWITGTPWSESSALAALPVRCEDARGAIDVDYKVKPASEPWNRYRTPSSACWYDEARLRALWPEHADLKHFDLSRQLYKSLGWSPTFEGDDYERTKTVALLALLPPAFLLLAGSLVVWAFAGFRSPVKRGEEA